MRRKLLLKSLERKKLLKKLKLMKTRSKEKNSEKFLDLNEEKPNKLTKKKNLMNCLMKVD